MSAEAVPPKPETIHIKDDPDPGIATHTNGAALETTKVKKEEPDDGKVDVDLPDAGQGDMFEDVDAPEVVDLTYEGIAEINGVDHFVCEGPLANIAITVSLLTNGARLQDSPNPKAYDCHSTIEITFRYVSSFFISLQVSWILIGWVRLY